MIGRGSAARRATHMVVPDKDRSASKEDPGSISQVIDLVKDYARQETLGPIKGAGRWLAAGAAGAVLLGTGCVFIVLGVLRMVQNEYGRSFRGSWVTMLPYVFAFVASLLVIGVAAWRISKKKTLQKGSR
jgi:hypothetical protein